MTELKRLHQILVSEFFLQPFDLFGRRPRLLVWAILNFIIVWLPTTTVLFVPPLLSMLLYMTVICLVLSDALEWLIRIIEDARRVATQTEKERLLPLFNEVYESVKARSEHINHNVRLYIIDSISINAVAIGNRTIAVTRGLMETMTDIELKGILAHELGHIANGDTIATLLTYLATSVVFWAVIGLTKLLKLVEQTLSRDSFVGSILAFIRSLVEFTTTYLLFLYSIIASFGSRKREYKADQYAHDIGYGEHLKSALYRLYDMQMSDKRTLLEKAQATHPKLCFRIEMLEIAVN